MSEVRPAAVAGRFYAHAPDRLRRSVAAQLAAARDTGSVPALAGLVVPHAGHEYSGPVAASAYRLVEAASFDRVLLLGPAHYQFVAGVAASRAGAWASPLGVVPVATDVVAQLAASGLVELDDAAHAPEHSLEVQLPFLQAVLTGQWAVVPLLVGHAEPDRVAAVIREVLMPGTLLVVSTDLSHYLPYEEARAVDDATALRIVRLDLEGIGDRAACGAYALRGALHWARGERLAVTQLDLRNSGDTAGSRDRVVGYGAFALLRRRDAAP